MVIESTGRIQLNILSELNAYLKSKITLYAPVTMDVFPSAIEAIKYNYDPSRAKVVQYIDKSSLSEQNVSYYCRSKTPETARLQCDAIAKALDICNFELTAGTFVSCLDNTGTAFVGTTDTGAAIYMVTLKIEFVRS
jgi:hypothetical protein